MNKTNHDTNTDEYFKSNIEASLNPIKPAINSRRGVPQKRVGVWLRVRDDYADDRLIDAATLREI